MDSLCLFELEESWRDGCRRRRPYRADDLCVAPPIADT